MSLHLGILLALACALLSNVSFFLKHRGACEAPAVDIRHPFRTAASLYRSKWFALGMLLAASAWLLHVAALSMAPMSVVQVVLAGGVVLIAVVADRVFGMEVGPRQRWGLACTAVGLVLLVVTLPQAQSDHSSFSLPAMIAFEAGLFGLGGLLIAGPRVGAPAHHHGVMLGAAAGVLFGVSNGAVKALTGILGDAGVVGVLLSPWLFCAVAASVIAFFASARGLQTGEAVPVIAITGTAANVSCIAGGILVFGDPLPGTAFGIVVQAFAFLLVIVASAMTPGPAHGTAPKAAPQPA